MNVIVVNNYDRMSEEAAKIIRAQIVKKPASVLGLATGSSPVGIYGLLAEFHQKGLDFSGLTTFNLDEYVGLPADHPASYHHYMEKELFSKVNIDPARIFIPNGAADDTAAECRRYEEAIKRAGGIDLQLLGIGENGHIGFNEPGSPFGAQTRVVELAESTIRANSRFFASKADVPTKAVSMGIKTIMRARSILLVANGGSKAQAIARAVKGPVTEKLPASVLQLHPDVTIVVDQAAAGG
ncbi:MAG TPA: glucosamine-6-phosphate deaminase, partial [Firmicutes bacterium]|nr:glucosamine-6-phosphate deaminase [Bacillota bacterium]